MRTHTNILLAFGLDMSEIKKDLSSAWNDAEAVLRDWFRRARESQHTHYEAARYFDSANKYLSIPVVVLSAVLGTSAFATLESQVGNEWKISFGLVAMLVAGIAAIQSNLKLADRSVKHRQIGASYGAIRREIEETLATPIEQRSQTTELLARIRAKLDHLASESPDIPRNIWINALKLAERDRKLSGSDAGSYIEGQD